MKRWKKILLGVLLLFLVAVIGLGIWQRNNIEAVYTVLTQDSATIAQNLEQKRTDHQAELEKQVPLLVAPLNTTQSNEVLNRTKTPEEVKDELGISAQLKNAGNEQNTEELVNSCIAELYSCKVDIMAQLSTLKWEALDVWNNLPDEARTKNAFYEMGFQGLEKCYALEVDTDKRVREILDRYEEKVKALQGDTQIFSDIWAYYEDEKTTEKAYYLDKYIK